MRCTLPVRDSPYTDILLKKSLYFADGVTCLIETGMPQARKSRRLHTLPCRFMKSRIRQMFMSLLTYNLFMFSLVRDLLCN